jgi:signal recognition particle GTPase
MDAIDVFYPIRMAERILNGDVVSWLKEHKSSLMRSKKRFKKKIAKK